MEKGNSKKAIQKALNQPTVIDMNLFYSQQGRRVLDRLLGFKLCPVLWRHIRQGATGGRCQSVALKLICDREIEINDFTPVPFYDTTGTFQTPEQSLPQSLEAKLTTKIKSDSTVKTFLEACTTPTIFTISSITSKEGFGLFQCF